jgi:hypothetical protein
MKGLDRETVRQLLYNLFCNSQTLDENEIVQEWSRILGDSADLASGETQRLIQDILDNEIRQLQYNSVDEGGHLSRDGAVEQYLDPDWCEDDFVLKVMEGLEKASKLMFKDPKTFLTNPDKPLTMSKVVREEVFRGLSGEVGWLDKHFSADGFYYLLDFDPKKVPFIKILTGPERVDREFKRQYKRAAKELKGRNVDLQARVILEESLLQEFHDRYLLGDNATYSMTPESIMVDKLGTIHDVPQEESKEIRARFTTYWLQALDPEKGSNWDNIQKARHKNEAGGGS